MARPLHLLIVEDSEDDAQLLVRELRKGGVEPDFVRVETPAQLAAALDAGPWDAVIADYNLPGFTGLDALRTMQAKGLDLPFILVSGVIGEEQAVEVMKAGAHDFVLKGRFSRLVPSLERELRDAVIRHERRQTAEELSRYREHLEDLVKERTAELENVNLELENVNLELENVNVELEAFNYTVAHDLRKPLTVVNGYCQAIKELCGDRLDEQCAGFLRAAYEGTLRMNRLIEALLNFSRLARCEIKRETVDLSAMAREIGAGLRTAEPDRPATFTVAEGVTADGDPALLRVVLENLLGNAWKYTARRQDALIEFGAAEIGGRPACFVRDNGPGFDMAYAEKLFLPFQRLPGAEEFKGHGIGLATVERIIRRHGGRVWAEGEPGKGATFYFTLPTRGE
jgi:signal transduction histidine kinase